MQNVIGQLADVVSPWFLWFMTREEWFADQVTGARWLAVIIGVVVMALGVLPALLLRERFAVTRSEDDTPLAAQLATRIGKRKAFFLAIGVSVIGYCLEWFCDDPSVPWLLLLPAPRMAFGLGGLFTLMGSMIADGVDEDELQTHARREGMFGSIYWWVVKLGMALALAGGGYLLNWTGFDVELGGGQAGSTILWMRICDAFVPAVTSLLAIAAVWRYTITEARAAQTRATLEARRGATG